MEKSQKKQNTCERIAQYDNLKLSANLALLVYMRGINKVANDSKTKKSNILKMIELTMPFSNNVLRYIDKP